MGLQIAKVMKVLSFVTDDFARVRTPMGINFTFWGIA